MLTAVRRSADGSVGILGVEEALDLAGAPTFRSSSLRLVAEGHRHLVVDLSAADFVDSVGVGQVLGLRRRVPPGGRVLVVADRPHLVELLDQTGCSSVVEVVPSLDEALARLGAAG